MDLEYICSLVQTICNGLFFCLQALFAFSFCSAHNQFTDFLFIFCLLNKVTNRVMKKLLDYESLLIKVVILRKQNLFSSTKIVRTLQLQKSGKPWRGFDRFKISSQNLKYNSQYTFLHSGAISNSQVIVFFLSNSPIDS